MDKYKTKTAFNKWLSPIKVKKLSLSDQIKIANFDKYHKKLSFYKALKIYLYAIDSEKESLRDLNTAFIDESVQKEMGLEVISFSQLSRKLSEIDSTILLAVFNQLLLTIKQQKPTNKRNSLYLVDSSTFSLNKSLFPWAEFRKTKSGIKLHLKYCFMDNEHSYPEEFKITHAVEHDDNHLEIFVNNPEATYVFDRGYLNFERMEHMHRDGYFFLTRIKKNTKVHVLEDFEVPESKLKNGSKIISDQMVALGSSTSLTSRFRLVTIEDEHGKKLQFVTNRFDLTAEEVAQAYKSRWQIELFFKHIKQHMTIKKFFSKSEQGVTNQLILAMIASLLTYLIKLETETTATTFQIKRYFRYLLFKPAEEWLEKLAPT